MRVCVCLDFASCRRADVTACGCFYVRRPQKVKSQAVLERRKRGGLKTKLSSEQISCTQQEKTGAFVENQIKTFDQFSR